MHIQMLTTTETAADARKIARGLVEARLAACVQIVGPITSVYRWQDGIEEDAEFQCLIKTRADLIEKVTTAIVDLHPYDTPEVIATPITGGSDDYLAWVDDVTG